MRFEDVDESGFSVLQSGLFLHWRVGMDVCFDRWCSVQCRLQAELQLSAPSSLEMPGCRTAGQMRANRYCVTAGSSLVRPSLFIVRNTRQGQRTVLCVGSCCGVASSYRARPANLDWTPHQQVTTNRSWERLPYGTLQSLVPQVGCAAHVLSICACVRGLVDVFTSHLGISHA